MENVSGGCPKVGKCPIFMKGVLFSESTGQMYRDLYCTDDNKFISCKRYMASNETTFGIPEKIMPNSDLTIDQIIERAKANHQKVAS